MKLKILKDFRLAQPETWLPHWSFKADEIIDTNNEHLIDRLLHYKAADILEKVSESKPEKEKKVTKRTKSHKTPKNKMYIPEMQDK